MCFVLNVIEEEKKSEIYVCESELCMWVIMENFIRLKSCMVKFENFFKLCMMCIFFNSCWICES